MTLKTSLRKKRSDLGLEVEPTFDLADLRHRRTVVHRMPKREGRNIGDHAGNGTNMEGILHMFSLSMSIFDPSSIEVKTTETRSGFKDGV